jgi:3-hydroxybutyryl-CoA dehydratase
MKVSQLKITDLHEGDEYSFEEVLTYEKITEFSRLTGDYSPIHIDSQFARDRGFQGRVVHGFLLASFFSSMVGMYFPGKDALILAVNLKFRAPAYINDRIKIIAKVEQLTLSVKVVTLKVTILHIETSKELCSGKIQVGFTN